MPQARYRTSRSTLDGYLPQGVKWLLIVNTAIFLICFFGRDAVQRHVTAILALSAEGAVRTFMVWQVFTYMFVHYDTLHLLFNMLGLWMFGVQIEQTWGTRRFVRFYLQCGLVAGLCVLTANILFNQWRIPTLGASGAVFGLLVAFGILFPDAIMLLFFLFPMRARYAVWIYVAVELLTLYGALNTGVATVAHLGGAAYAYVVLKMRMPSARIRMPDIAGAYRQWKLQRAKKKFQVYMRKHGGGGGPYVN
jgi:membrane associated rhomboid family serine protease